MGMGTKEEDFVEKIFIASTHHYLLVFTSAGKVHWLKVYQIPQAGRAAKGKAMINLVSLAPGESVRATLPVKEFVEDKFIVMVTKKGIIKKTELAAYANPRNGGIIAVSIDEGDELVDVQLTMGNQDIFLATRLGMAIRFKEDDVRDMGRTARGVRGINLDEGDDVIGVDIPAEGAFLLTVSENGFGKCTPIDEYRVQTRGGKGTINLKTVAKVGNVSGVLQVAGEENVMLISNAGKVIRLKVQEIPVNHRVTQGVKLIELDPEEKLVGVARTTSEAEGRDDETNGNGDDETDLTTEENGTPEEN
jgi:DNA gyrase subunit A